MARPSKKTPAKVARLRAARAEGKGLRAAAKEAGISHETARAWEQDAFARQKQRLPHGVAHMNPRADAGPAGVLDDLRTRIAFLEALLARLGPAVERDEYPVAGFVGLSRYLDELNIRRAELEPPVPAQDGAASEDVREAERILLARLEAMVGEAEAKVSGERRSFAGDSKPPHGGAPVNPGDSCARHGGAVANAGDSIALHSAAPKNQGGRP
jgi:hypothetical protein